jgi:reactive intermediate/imine deaminase
VRFVVTGSMLTAFVMIALTMIVPILAIAQTGGGPIKRTNPPTLSTPTGYTHVVEVTGPVKTVYIAGQIAFDKDGKVAGADMKAQTEQVFKNLEAALAAAGAKFSDVVKMNTYVTDLSQVAAIREVRARYFGNTTPASTLVQVAALARPELMIEIEVIAAVAAR